MYPRTAEETRQLAKELIAHLKQNTVNTDQRPKWTDQNFAVLSSFASLYGAENYPTAKGTLKEERRPQFMWDFVAHGPEGLLLVAESEFDTELSGIKHDFEKLLYSRCPLKIMICRVKNEAEAKSFANELAPYMKTCSFSYAPAEAFILYCVWWAENGVNRDFAYLLQVPGEPVNASIDNLAFEVV